MTRGTDATPGQTVAASRPGVARGRLVDVDSPAWVYWMRNADFQVIYIGVTGDRAGRMRSHAKSSPFWHEVADVLWSEQLTRDEAEEREAWHIAHERPRYNTRGKGLPPAPVKPVFDEERLALQSPRSRSHTVNRAMRRYEAELAEWEALVEAEAAA